MKSLQETIETRRSVRTFDGNELKADERKPFETLFFQNDFNTPLKEEDAGIYKGALSALRLAPSATNGQPWRAVVVGEAVHVGSVENRLPPDRYGERLL